VASTGFAATEGRGSQNLAKIKICRMRALYGSLDYVRDNPGELVPEGTFRHLLDFMVQNEDKTGRRTNNPDGLPPHPD